MNQIITGVCSLLGVLIGVRAVRRDSAKKQACDAARELLCAACAFKAALHMWEARWRRPSGVLHTFGHAMAHVLAGYKDGRLFRGAIDGIGTALTWRRSAEEADEALVTGPMSRMNAAAVDVSLLDDVGLRAAARAVADAGQALGAAYARRANAAARARTGKEFDEAVARLADAARTHVRPGRRWLRWSRAK
ncbi:MULTISPECIES: hypothetical protein [unclassified Streptomyces]|uniref:hypothetical protein n=1 Tax=unclassified Streptomyces TaxID=2593676 RepID=UPI003805B763